MRCRWLLLIMVSTVFRLPVSQAQIEGWSNGCDTVARPAIAATTTQLDYHDACEAYLECRANDSDVNCQMKTLLDLESTCEDDNSLCRLRARLYAAALTLPDNVGNPFRLEHFDQLPPIFVSALTHFESGDYDAALADYRSITPDISQNPIVHLSVGLTAEAADEDL